MSTTTFLAMEDGHTQIACGTPHTNHNSSLTPSQEPLVKSTGRAPKAPETSAHGHVHNCGCVQMLLWILVVLLVAGFCFVGLHRCLGCWLLLGTVALRIVVWVVVGGWGRRGGGGLPRLRPPRSCKRLPPWQAGHLLCIEKGGAGVDTCVDCSLKLAAPCWPLATYPRPFLEPFPSVGSSAHWPLSI